MLVDVSGDSISSVSGISAEDEIAALTDSAEEEADSADWLGKFKDSYIYVSKAKMKLYVLSREDSVLFYCGIACGARRGDKVERGDYRTPEGRFRICGIYESTEWIHKTRDGRKVKGCYGPYFLSLATGRWIGIGIHGTNSPRSIGKRASEGCIRVLSKNIITIFKRYAYDGMPVIVGGEKEPLPRFIGLDVPVEENDAVRCDSLAERAAATADSLRADSLKHRSAGGDSVPDGTLRERPETSADRDSMNVVG